MDLQELDRRLVAVAKNIAVLRTIAWPEGVVERFLEGWRRGQVALPEVEPPARSVDHVVEALEAIATACDEADPLGELVARTARAYATAGRMLDAAGTPDFTKRSCELYGAPDDVIPGTALSHHAAATHLLDATARLQAAGAIPERAYCVTAVAVQRSLSQSFDAFFGEEAPEVVIDPDLASKAAAGATRVRLRAATCFSDLDVVQLTEHEGFVHVATALNGRAQPVLSCLGLSSPRTTATQEGLATFAELTTRAIDVARLRRIALRTVAIHRALDGADYVDTFRFFREQGQSEDESAHSAMRVFRGGDVTGRVAFTKDVVYLAGLFAVHGYIRRAIEEPAPHRIERLFAGRLTLGDVARLAPAFDDGRLVPPRFVPAWATALPQLAADLALISVIADMDIAGIDFCD